MKNFRLYGLPPYETAVIHGGPGAPGEMAPVARRISSYAGVLEPLQTAKTIDSQIEELEETVTMQGDPPVVLIGWSWGAWLSFLWAARNPPMVKKLILVASGPFEDKYAHNIMKIRLERLKERDRVEALLLIDRMDKPAGDERIAEKNDAFMRLGKLISKADDFHPVSHKDYALECQSDVFRSVWDQAEKLRKSGELLQAGKNIQCPVVAIHGVHDPHPAEGVRRPLTRILKDFRFVLLEKCGHKPWIERAAKNKFFSVLSEELC